MRMLTEYILYDKLSYLLLTLGQRAARPSLDRRQTVARPSPDRRQTAVGAANDPELNAGRSDTIRFYILRMLFLIISMYLIY